MINNPLLLEVAQLTDPFFYNASKSFRSSGFKTNVKLIFKEALKLFARYTFTYATTNYQSGNIFLPLVPKNKLNLALVFKRENKFKVDLEGYFADRQYLCNGNKTPSFWKFGFMAEKTFNKVALFINFENFTAQRQSNYKRVVNPPYNDPTFDDIWNYTEGFIVNGGIK